MRRKVRSVEPEPQGSPLDAVLGCIARGWDVIPIPSGSKKPGKGWNERAPITEATAPHYFNGRPQNIGVRLGQRSGGLTDVDLDALEAVELAPYFLPPTHAVFGRPSKLRSHYLYTVANFPTLAFRLPGKNGEMIVEARADNRQTVIPPGIHTSGEQIEWHEQGEPGTPSAEELERAVLHLAVAALLLRHYPEKDGGRHNYTLAISGALLRDGKWTVDEVRHLVEVVGTAAEDEELTDRLKNVESTARKVEEEKRLVSGWTMLGEMLDEKSIRALKAWIKPRPKTDPNLPTIDVSMLYRPITLKAFDRLAAAGVYRTEDGRLVDIRDKGEGLVTTRTLNADLLRGPLDRNTNWVRGNKSCYPPPELAKMLLAEPVAPLPLLTQIATAPIYTPDGRLLDRPGHDPASGILTRFRFEPRPVPASPTKSQLKEARELWAVEALGDFPFETPSDRTTALALALTPLARPLIPGPTPLFDISASTPGTGKGLLRDLCLLPTRGRAQVPSLPAWKNDEELRKTLTTQLLEQRSVISFDNLTNYLNTPILAKALTDERWGDRLLSLNRAADLPVLVTWVITSNNLSYSDEIARRTVPIRLVPSTEHPELRTDFRHPNLLEWASEHRADLLWALCVFVEHWRAVGRPRPKGQSAVLGSYEGWVRVVGGILEAAGFEGFLATRSELVVVADSESQTWSAFTAAWWEGFKGQPADAGSLLPLAQQSGIPLKGETESGQATSLGRQLAKKRDAIFGGYQIRLAPRGNSRGWYLAPVVPKGSEQGHTRAGNEGPLPSLPSDTDASAHHYTREVSVEERGEIGGMEKASGTVGSDGKPSGEPPRPSTFTPNPNDY